MVRLVAGWIENSQALRWMLLLPTALAGSLATYFLIRLAFILQTLIARLGENIFSYLVLSLLSHVALGYLFVAIGTAVAPSGRKLVSIVLFFLISAVFSLLSLWALAHAFGTTDFFAYSDTLAFFSTVIAAGYYLYTYMDKGYVLFWDRGNHRKPPHSNISISSPTNPLGRKQKEQRS